MTFDIAPGSEPSPDIPIEIREEAGELLRYFNKRLNPEFNRLGLHLDYYTGHLFGLSFSRITNLLGAIEDGSTARINVGNLFFSGIGVIKYGPDDFSETDMGKNIESLRILSYRLEGIIAFLRHQEEVPGKK